MKNIKNLISKLSNKKFLSRLGLVFAFLIITGGLYFYLKHIDRVFIEDSLIQAPTINISTTTAGNLIEVDVLEGQTVHKGDQLAVIGTQVLRAGTDGVIIKTDRQIGAVVSAQNNIVQMIDPNDFRVAGTIDENKGLENIKVGQVVSFTADAFQGKTYWGFVDEVSPTAKQTQLAFSISSERPTQQFVVYAKFDPQKYPELKNGMSAKMTVYTKTN